MAANITGRIILAIVLLSGLGIRIVWAIHLPADEERLQELPDQLEYLELGRNLVSGEGLKFYDRDFFDHVRAYRAPGYPLLIAACGGNVRAVRVAQAFISASMALAACLLARRWLAGGPSIFAAALVAFNPFLIYFTGLILSETVFAALLIWGMTGIVYQEKRAWWWCGAILLVSAILVRPSALLLPTLLAIAGAIANRGVRGPYHSRWSPPVGAIMVLLTFLALLPWAYRNYRVLGSWIWTTTNSGITLYDGFNPDATGASNQAHVRSWPHLRQMGEVGRSEYLSQLAWQYIREHPRRTFELAGAKIARTWSPVPLSDAYGTRRNVVIAAAYTVPFYILIVAGLWFGRIAASVKVFLLLPAIYLTIAHALSVGSLRYRVPADVPMAVLAAAAVSAVRRRDPSVSAD